MNGSRRYEQPVRILGGEVVWFQQVPLVIDGTFTNFKIHVYNQEPRHDVITKVQEMIATAPHALGKRWLPAFFP